MSRVHWIGAGLSSVPGIRRIAESGQSLTVWNRTLEKAEAAVAGLKNRPVVVKRFEPRALGGELRGGDLVVSMLPAPMHLEIAEICLAKKAHLVTTSYLSDRMRGFDTEARRLGLCFVNESGLDPGLDHMMVHQLVASYRESGESQDDLRLSFCSYCGGFPKNPGPFRYKFSWSPIGVLRALKAQTRYLQDGKERVTELPYRDLRNFSIAGEEFEAYPNRDSLPYLKEYRFDPKWQVEGLIRGTLRPTGWSNAWKAIFEEIEPIDLVREGKRLEQLSDRLWKEYQYKEGEPDRVVLYVALEGRREERVVWSKAAVIDEIGSAEGSAMARLVSLPASLAVDYVLSDRAPKGVSGAPNDLEEIKRWFKLLSPIRITWS